MESRRTGFEYSFLHLVTELTQECWLNFLRIHFLALKNIFYLFIFRERGMEGEKGRETAMCKRYMDRMPIARPQPGTWPSTQASALTGNRTSNLLVPRLALNPLSHTSQGKDPFFYVDKRHINVLPDINGKNA